MTGELDPPSDGTYEYIGEYGGKPSYQEVANGWFIWWSTLDSAWYISTVRGDTGVAWWERIDPDIEGEYGFQGTATGIATVTVI